MKPKYTPFTLKNSALARFRLPIARLSTLWMEISSIKCCFGGRRIRRANLTGDEAKVHTIHASEFCAGTFSPPHRNAFHFMNGDQQNPVPLWRLENSPGELNRRWSQSTHHSRLRMLRWHVFASPSQLFPLYEWRSATSSAASEAGEFARQT